MSESALIGQNQCRGFSSQESLGHGLGAVLSRRMSCDWGKPEYITVSEAARMLVSDLPTTSAGTSISGLFRGETPRRGIARTRGTGANRFTEEGNQLAALKELLGNHTFSKSTCLMAAACWDWMLCCLLVCLWRARNVLTSFRRSNAASSAITSLTRAI